MWHASFLMLQVHSFLYRPCLASPPPPLPKAESNLGSAAGLATFGLMLGEVRPTVRLEEACSPRAQACPDASRKAPPVPPPDLGAVCFSPRGWNDEPPKSLGSYHLPLPSTPPHKWTLKNTLLSF